MKYARLVSLVALTLISSLTQRMTAQSPGMQKGISVELAAYANSAPVPEADNDDAFIVTITNHGTVYIGAGAITLPDLKEKVRSTPFKRGQKLYIKADARTPYATVLQVLDATRTGGNAPQILLTARNHSTSSGPIVPPDGVEVQLAPPSPR